jgi:hypothetical protein
LLYFIDLIKFNKNKIKIADISANTLPILLGTLRRIVYANKKYHSGWIWIGVIIGFVLIKLSLSLLYKEKLILY